MATIKVLVKGYAYTKNDIEHGTCNTTLLQSSKINVVVDPGMNRSALLRGLARIKLRPRDIQHVILTHTHLDHALLTGIFEKADIYDDSSVYSQKGTIKTHRGKIPGTEIKIISTPGHDQFHCSVVAKTKEHGTVVVAGDVFWWYDREKQLTDRRSLLARQDPFAKNARQLDKSRRKLLKLADYIIPGHGKIFKVKRN